MISQSYKVVWKIASGMLLPDFAFSCNNLRRANVNKRYIICFTFYTLNSVYIFSKLYTFIHYTYTLYIS